MCLGRAGKLKIYETQFRVRWGGVVEMGKWRWKW